MLAKWKKWLSYLMELHVESRSSEFNPHLYVSLSRGRYQLSTANAIYSYGDLYTNFSRTFDCWNWAEFTPDNVLLLGLGLGSIPVLLEEKHQYFCRYTAVEIDEEIVDLAYQYVLGELESPIEIITADANAVVRQLPDSSYDLICVDIFDDAQVPPAFETPHFLEACQRLLNTNGVLLFNRLAYTPEDEEESRSFFDTTFSSVFPESYCLDVKGNLMLVSRQDALLR